MVVNLSRQLDPAVFQAHLDTCFDNGVAIFITATGDPSETVKQIHDRGDKVFHEVTNMRFAEKAIASDYDGLN